ncbi:MAG: ribonuclease H-like domain-containing protein [Anaerolineales bacterium]|nr:ribonuclease H-like domain-containing protein [Anaerolineales bacterium]
MANAKRPSLADKLKALGVKTGVTDLEPAGQAPGVRTPIQAVVEGHFVAGRRGEAFVVEQAWDANYRHGQAPLPLTASLAGIAAWSGDPRLLEMPVEALAFLDTETSGLAGGTGTYAFMVGVGRFDRDVFRTSIFFMRDPSEEPALLEALVGYLAPCQALVTFNGKAFDAPLLATRYTMHSIPNPFENFLHLDLLPLARRLWRDRLPSRALKYLEENILMAPRGSEEVPGYEIPYIYFDYLRSGDATPLKGVFYHNAMDVVAMAALLNHMAALLDDPFDGRVQHALDFVALAKLFESLSNWDLAARLYERGLESELAEADFWAAVQRLSALQRRRGDLETAVRLWKQAAGQGHVYAHVELAKYYEHRVRDVGAALEWTRRAMERIGELDIPRYEYNHWMEELRHRHARLETKGGKTR